MGDEEVAKLEFLLELDEQVEDLSLDRHVEGRNGFIANDQLRAKAYGAPNADTLLLATGKLMGVAMHHIGLKAYFF